MPQETSWLHDLILGGQDGLVNTLGLALGAVAAGADTRLVVAAALAGAIAESVSMGAVAYTSEQARPDRRPTTDLLRVALVVGTAALVGSLIPLVSFILAPSVGWQASLVLSSATLFVVGVYSATRLQQHRLRGGIQLVAIGMAAAFTGFLAGRIFGAGA
jgi:VIT1/CCC1 family predicted Fe2+/Mn2+ transporter